MGYTRFVSDSRETQRTRQERLARGARKLPFVLIERIREREREAREFENRTCYRNTR